MSPINISSVHNCYGCGLCATTCPKGIISIQLNADGFYEPRIANPDSCIGCSLCVDVCSYLHKDFIMQEEIRPRGYAAWSNDNLVRKKCSSGGISFELGRLLINKGYKVCGVRYKAQSNRAEHFIATTMRDLVWTIGSKYIQSYTLDGFRAMDRNKRYMVIGTPCQMDSFRRYIRKFKCEDNFLLIDFFCHGVPSMWMWNKYIKKVEKITGPVTYVSWRNKFSGWHNSWLMGVDGASHSLSNNQSNSYEDLIKERKTFYQSDIPHGDAFYRIFLDNGCLGPACYEKCKFKRCCSSADIRIGDFLGETFKSDEKGTSAVITLTEKGDSILKESSCQLIECPLEKVMEGQMETMPPKPKYYYALKKTLNNPNTSISVVEQIVLKAQRRSRILRIMKNPLKAIIHLVRRLHI